MILKKHTFLLILITVVCTIVACNHMIIGNGKAKVTQRKINPFNEIKVKGSLAIYLTQGAEESLEIATDANLHSRIKSKVEDGVLYLSIDDKINQPSYAQAYVTYRSLDNIVLDNKSELHAKSLVAFDRIHITSEEHSIVNLYIESDTLDISAAGTSSFELKGETDQANIKLKGKSQLKGFALKIDSCNVSTSEFSIAELYVMKQLNTQQKGRSEVIYRGAVKDETIRSKGNGRIRRHIKEKDEI